MICQSCLVKMRSGTRCVACEQQAEIERLQNKINWWITTDEARKRVIAEQRKEIEKLKEDNADLFNWRGAVTNQLCPSYVGEISRGRAVELITELRKCRDVPHEQFRVKRWKDTKASPLVVRYGTCYSFYGHFDIYWDDGEHQLDVADLSYIGVFKE